MGAGELEGGMLIWEARRSKGGVKIDNGTVQGAGRTYLTGGFRMNSTTSLRAIYVHKDRRFTGPTAWQFRPRDTARIALHARVSTPPPLFPFPSSSSVSPHPPNSPSKYPRAPLRHRCWCQCIHPQTTTRGRLIAAALSQPPHRSRLIAAHVPPSPPSLSLLRPPPLSPLPPREFE